MKYNNEEKIYNYENYDEKNNCENYEEKIYKYITMKTMKKKNIQL